MLLLKRVDNLTLTKAQGGTAYALRLTDFDIEVRRKP